MHKPNGFPPSGLDSVRALQIGFEFTFEPRPRSVCDIHGNRIPEGIRVLVESLTRLCSPGHCAIPENQLLMHARQQTNLNQLILLKSLRRAVQQRLLAREIIGDVAWTFPTALRDTEITIARCARQLAEGPAIMEHRRGKLEKFALLGSSDVYLTLDLVTRMLSRTQAAGFHAMVLAPGVNEANWFRVKLGRAVLECKSWLRGDRQATDRLFSGGATAGLLIVILDASRLGVEAMAPLLEAVPPESAVVLVGNPDEVPAGGHGQPFRDLLSCQLFQNLIVGCDRARTASARPSSAAVRRSALCWRLRRGAGLHANSKA